MEKHSLVGRFSELKIHFHVAIGRLASVVDGGNESVWKLRDYNPLIILPLSSGSTSLSVDILHDDDIFV